MINDNNVTDNLKNDIETLTQEYINTLNDPSDIYKNHTITGLFHYIYNNYIGDLLNNKRVGNRPTYNNIQLLDDLFNIYIDLCFRFNNTPTILEFSLFTGINRDTFNTWLNGYVKNVTTDYTDTVKKWRNTCELAQVKDQGVKSIFLLKAVYNYNDEHIAQETIQERNIEKLPDLHNDPKSIVQIAQRENDV